MKNILITGTNGMIGKLILGYCLQRADVNKVTSITRKKTGVSHPKLIEVNHNDFLDYIAVEEYLEKQDICFYCIGVYTGQVPKEEFRKITVDCTKALAIVLKQKSPEVSFCFLSGQGADLSEKSSVMFARDKGVAENILINTHFKKLGIFRPGYIYPVTPRKEPSFLYKVFRLLYKPLLSKIYPNMGISSEDLAQAMIKVGFNGGDKIIYENQDIRQLSN